MHRDRELDSTAQQNLQVDAPENTVVHRQRTTDDTTQHIDRRGRYDRRRCIENKADAGPRACEVDSKPIPMAMDA